jgi:acyl carrier protein
VAERTRSPPEAIDPAKPITSFGVDSLMAIEFAEAIATWTGAHVSDSAIFDHPTIQAIVAAFGGAGSSSAAEGRRNAKSHSDWETVRI